MAGAGSREHCLYNDRTTRDKQNANTYNAPGDVEGWISTKFLGVRKRKLAAVCLCSAFGLQCIWSQPEPQLLPLKASTAGRNIWYDAMDPPMVNMQVWLTCTKEARKDGTSALVSVAPLCRQALTAWQASMVGDAEEVSPESFPHAIAFTHVGTVDGSLCKL